MATHRHLLISRTSTGPTRLLVGLVAALAIAAMTTGCGADDASGTISENQGDDGPPAPDVVTEIDTVVQASTIAAGDTVDVSCDYLNPDGDPVDVSDEIREGERVLSFPDNAFQQSDDGQLVAVGAGDTELACQNSELGLTDTDRLELTVEAGDIETTVAELDDYQIVAGEDVDATCTAFDEYGNQVSDADFELIVDTSSSGIDIDHGSLSATITTTGILTFSCNTDNPAQRFGDAVEVLPDRPANIQADPTPNQDVYSTGQVITVGTFVTDQYGNTIPNADLDFSVFPDGPDSEVFGNNRFHFYDDGIYSVTVEVVEPTHNNEELSAHLEFVINASGPDIDCLDPVDGAMVHHTPGDDITFGGSVSDDHNIEEITVNGDPLADVGKGDFETTITTRFGINFVDIAATDEHGEQNVRTCSFLVSDSWVDEGSYEFSWQNSQIDDAIALQLRQDAIDDGDPASWSWQIESLNDLITLVINSEGLRQEVQSEIMAGNAYDPDFCGFDLYIDAVLFTGDDHVTSFDLVDGGIDLFAQFNDIAFETTITDGNWYCPGTYSPTVTLEYVELEATTEMFLSNNMPTLQLDEVTNVESGEVNADGSNFFSDAMYSAVTSLFQGTLRGIIEDTFEDAIVDNFDDLFGDLLDSFDIDSLATEFDVPRLDSDETMTLDFGFGFSSVDVDSTRALFGLAPEISPGLDDPDDAIGTESLGVAHPAGDFLVDPYVSTAGATVHLSLLNQALHSLWRGGLFHADVGGALGDDLPDDAQVDLEVGLPPVVALDGDDATLMLGAVNISLVYPGIFDEPVSLDVGATATTEIAINGNEIDFDDVELDEFHLSPRDISINSGTRDVLEGFLGSLFQDILDQSINAALPSLPIPSFTIPWSMWSYDLPAGDDIGLVNPSLDQTETHLRLQSDFGIQ